MQGDTRDAVALDPWVGKIPWRRKSQPTPVFLPRECYGWRSLEGFGSRGCKESDMTKRLSTHAQQTVYLWSACFTVHNYASLLKIEKKKDWDTKNWLEAPYLRGGAPFCWGCPKMSVSGVFLFVCLFVLVQTIFRIRILFHFWPGRAKTLMLPSQEPSWRRGLGHC